VLQVVVDRLKIEGDLRARLTDSIEIAYQEGGGAAWAVQLGDPPVTHAFSERFECRRCNITYEDPQPRLFSFNNPFGACPTCHGFGNVIELDMELVVPDPSKSIAQGAIEPWTKPHYRAQLAALKRLAKARGIRLDVPWRDLPEDQRRLIIEGDGEGGKSHPVFSVPEILAKVTELGRKGMQLQRFKGLGEMNAKELFTTTMDPTNRKLLRVKMDDDNMVEADRMFTVLMGDVVEPRRQFIEGNALSVRNLDI